MLIIGFMIGSVVQVFPGLPSGIGIPVCAVTLLAGFGVIFWIGRFDAEKN
jgi:putative membrane protein